jgi:Rod binding domain-containing protein
VTSALPPIDQATLPAEVRNGTKQDKKAYQAALGFERMLLGELTKTLADTAKPIDGGDSADGGSGQPQDAASSMYMQMLPDQLADAVTSAGGLGLAKNFYETIKERS